MLTEGKSETDFWTGWPPTWLPSGVAVIRSKANY